MIPTALAWRRSIAALVLFAALGGCATMNKSECLTVDWRTVGYEDGAKGYSGDRIAQHRKACAKHGVSTDLALYQAGRAQGLAEYCLPDKGFRLGESGASYQGVCPANLEAAFLGGYNSGHQLYVLRARVADAGNQLEARHRQLADIDSGLAAASAAIIDNDSSKQQRAQALVDIKHLTEQRGRVKNEIRQLEEDRVQFQRDLEDYTAGLSASG